MEGFVVCLRPMLQKILSVFEGEPGKKEEKQFRPIVEQINALSDEVKALSNEEIVSRSEALKKRVIDGASFDEVRVEAGALVREAAFRTAGLRHYDVQLLGGLILANQAIAEMKTGEGKTLVATFPVYLKALAGKGVHVVTVNDYLARRDAAWMGQVYHALGMSVGVVTGQGAFVYDPGHTEIDADRDEKGFFKVYEDFLRPVSKKEAYGADITYGTNNEFGFDYLRDNTAYSLEQRVQRGQFFALIDEVDSVLIDEARTPLIISAPYQESGNLYQTFAGIVKNFKCDEDYVVDEKNKAVEISDSGIEKAEKALGIDNLYVEGGMKYAHHLESAVRAQALFKKDKEYVVRDGEVVIVDEFTGRLQPGRRWSDGLHQAVEAKEGTSIRQENRTIASITFQNYFRLYESLAGMTGTAYSSKEEFYTVYELDVVPVPTHRPLARIDNPDLIFQTAAGKYKALARRVRELHEKGQPVLIGTVAIEDNDIVSTYLTKEKVPHEVLNAKNHEREGEIVASAGERGRVTVATNMAGRGVDIKLGGETAREAEREEIKKLGGLMVLGTERHEARRIDDQLRGRSGRQGDPGETQFYVSFDDKLMRIFATDGVKALVGRLGIPEDEPVVNNQMVSNTLQSAQKKIEGVNFDSRKQVLAYDDVLNHQRKIFYGMRNKVLAEDIGDVVREFVAHDPETLAALEKKEAEFGVAELHKGVRTLLLQLLDRLWLDHLETMEYLRRSVSLRAYGQRDPLIEYRREGLNRFKEMEASITEQIKFMVPRLEEKKPVEEKPFDREQLNTVGGAEETETKQVVKEEGYGRNDVVTIVKGDERQELKYKKAEQLLKEGWRIVKDT